MIITFYSIIKYLFDIPQSCISKNKSDSNKNALIQSGKFFQPHY